MLVMASSLLACGGDEVSVVAPTNITISGTVAIGKAVDGAIVMAKCHTGSGTSTTAADGTYRLNVTVGMLPCVLQAANQADGSKLHTVITGTSSVATANITTLTEMLTARVLRDDPATFFASFEAAAVARNVTITAVNAAQVDVVTVLADIVNASFIDNFIATPLTAATVNNPYGDEQDKLLDALRAKLSASQVLLVVAALARSESIEDIKKVAAEGVMSTQAKLTSAINPATNSVRLEWTDSFPVGTKYLVESQNVNGSFTTLQALSGAGGTGTLLQWQPAVSVATIFYRVRAVLAGRSVVLSTAQGGSIVNVTFPTVSIAKWLGDARSALSFVWDDNNHQHYDVIGPIFEKYGYRASFALITYPLVKYPDNQDVAGYKSLLEKGHELCSHSVDHIGFNDLTEAVMRYELGISKQNIIDIFGVIPSTFIYPGNGMNPNVDVVPEYYLYTRIHNIHQDPENFIANMDHKTDLARLNYIYSLNVEKRNWVTLAGHGVDGNGFEPILSRNLDGFLYAIKDQSVWVDTYSNVALYNEIRLAISSVSIYDQQIVIDDSNINYGKYAAFGMTSIPVTVIINSADPMDFVGTNILDVKRINQQYVVTVNLFESNTIHWNL